MVGAFISRLTLTLEHTSKVDYEEVTLSSDYVSLMVNSASGSKYRDYTIAVESMHKI